MTINTSIINTYYKPLNSPVAWGFKRGEEDVVTLESGLGKRITKRYINTLYPIDLSNKPKAGSKKIYAKTDLAKDINPIKNGSVVSILVGEDTYLARVHQIYLQHEICPKPTFAIDKDQQGHSIHTTDLYLGVDWYAENEFRNDDTDVLQTEPIPMSIQSVNDVTGEVDARIFDAEMPSKS